MKLLLTGGTGFFGKALLRHLSLIRPTGIEVVVISRNPERFLAINPEFTAMTWLTFMRADIQDRNSLPWDQSFDRVLHAATESTNNIRLTNLQCFDQIINGTKNILDLAINAGVKRFLYISSGAIYGSQPADLTSIPETWRGAPPLCETNTAYGQGKRAAEHLCLLSGEQHGLEVVIARCFSFVGPDLPIDAHFAIGNFIRDAITANVITVKGDGSPLRTYLDQSDLARWLIALLDQGRNGEAYNVGSNEIISIAEVAKLVRDVLAPEKK